MQPTNSFQYLPFTQEMLDDYAGGDARTFIEQAWKYYVIDNGDGTFTHCYTIQDAPSDVTVRRIDDEPE